MRVERRDLKHDGDNRMQQKSTLRLKSIRSWVVVFVVLAGAITPCAVLYIDVETTRNNFIRRSNEVIPAVVAIYRYRYAHGLWPDDISEVALNQPIEDWIYIWPGYDAEYGPVLRLTGPLHMTIEYRFPVDPASKSEGWTGSCEGDEFPLKVDQMIPAAPTIPREELNRRVIDELHRRIRNDPKSQLHRRALERLEDA